MRTSNKYHKFIWYGVKRTARGEWEGVQTKIRFDYVEGENIMREITQLFKGFNLGTETRKLVTQQYNDLEVDDRIVIDGSPNLIVKIHKTEEHRLGGQRFKGRKRTYLFEVT